MNTSIGFKQSPLLWLLLGSLLLGVAAAQDAPDPSGRIARLSYASGSVALQPAGVNDWADATLNRPLTTGDKLWVDRESRAELQVGSASIHLDQGTGFSFLDLDDHVMQMRLTDGVINLRVRRLDDDETVEVDTPNAAVVILRPGEYRISTSESGDATRVAVRSGESEVSGGGRTVSVRSNEQGVFTGEPEAMISQIRSLPPRDDFDAWSDDRNRRGERSVSARYVSPDVVGYEDLDEYGEWSPDPEYGTVWIPRTVAVDWAPYRFGHWIWIAPWGWTWVDDAPWGFAPFHYGRWAYTRSRWCWVPGPRRERAYYAPALVAWVGGSGFSLSISTGGGGVGWFPLGPREVYMPRYRTSERYVRNVNVSNTTIVNNTYITNIYNNRVTNINYRYRHEPHAVTAVSRTTFTSARPVAHNRMSWQPRELANSKVDNRGPAIEPVKESVLGPNPRGPNVRRPPEHLVDRPVVARTPPPRRVPFERQQQMIRANSDRPPQRAVETSRDRERAGEQTQERPAPRVHTDRPPNAIQSDRQSERVPVPRERPDQPDRSDRPDRSPSPQERPDRGRAEQLPHEDRLPSANREALRPAPSTRMVPADRPHPSPQAEKKPPPKADSDRDQPQRRPQSQHNSR